MERIGLAARAHARKQAHKNLVEGLEQGTIAEKAGFLIYERKAAKQVIRGAYFLGAGFTPLPVVGG